MLPASARRNLLVPRRSSSGGAMRIVFSPAPSRSRPFSNAQVHDRFAEISGALLGLLVAHDFDADHQSFAAHIADNSVPRRPVRPCGSREIRRRGAHFRCIASPANPWSPAPPPRKPDCRRKLKRARRASSPSSLRAQSSRKAACPKQCPWPRTEYPAQFRRDRWPTTSPSAPCRSALRRTPEECRASGKCSATRAGIPSARARIRLRLESARRRLPRLLPDRPGV